jgi:hypothetical protein
VFIALSMNLSRYDGANESMNAETVRKDPKLIFANRETGDVLPSWNVGGR